MNREQKGVAVAEIAAEIEASEAIFAVDYRGMTVAQAAELRAKLTESDTKLKVVKNSLTERAADQTGSEVLKPLLIGPTALAFVKGDAAMAAKALADYARATQLLPFKGGVMGGEAMAPEQMLALSRLPSREVLYGQLVGIVASPVSGLVRTLGALVGGLAVALGQVREKKESGEIPAGSAPKPAAAEPEAEAPAEPEAKAPAEPEAEADSAPETADDKADEAPETAAEQAAAPETVADKDDNEADASAGDEAGTETAEATKED